MLKQVRVPHHYYYREMYLPQAASGTAARRPGPRTDGSWRSRSRARSVASTPRPGVARQLTDGPGYDYQPDWSPDGRFLAYACYRDDALELRMLELASGNELAAR